MYVYARDRRGRVKGDRDIRGEKKREREREEGQKEEADMRRMREREACTRTRLVCGGNISTEINQGCTQISKRKITKINRPDVQCDKKALPSSFSPFSLFSLSLSLFLRAILLSLSSSRSPLLLLLLLAKVPAETRPSMDTKRPTARQNSRGVYINYTDRTHKISMNKPATSLIAPHAP